MDFSMTDGFSEEELPDIERRIKGQLGVTFGESGFEVFDVTFAERPRNLREDLRDFWGGYVVEFKVSEKGAVSSGQNLSARRRQSVPIDTRHRKKMRVEISRFEICNPRETRKVQGFTVNVCAPSLIVVEKLRAICQQMPAYREEVVTHSPTPRAKDFFDIYTVIDAYELSLTTPENKTLIREVFAAKRVPLELLDAITESRGFHRAGFASVKDTVKTGYELKDFDFYFDYVLSVCPSSDILRNV